MFDPAYSLLDFLSDKPETQSQKEGTLVTSPDDKPGPEEAPPEHVVDTSVRSEPKSSTKLRHRSMANVLKQEVEGTSARPIGKEKKSTKYENETLGKLVNRIGFNQFEINVALLVLFLIGAVGLVVLFKYVPASERALKLSSGMNAESHQTLIKDFEAKFQAVTQNFPSQSTRFWKVVRAACKSVLRESHPSQPAVVMLGGHEEHSRTTECIAHHITKAFTDVYTNAAEPQMLSPDDYDQYPDVGNLKMHIDNAVRTTFDGGSRAVLVSEINRVPGKAAAMFHAFCDNENAPYKDVLIVFTVHTDIHIVKQHAVENYLENIWRNELRIDTLSSLLSRMANGIALVQGENDAVLDKHCKTV